jgi:hypothetical protein
VKRERKAPAGGIVLEAKRNDWQTPEHVLERVRLLHPRGRIALDPCTAPDNPTKADWFCALGDAIHSRANDGFLASNDGLAFDWTKYSRGGLVFVNAPYGEGERGSEWCRKTADEARKGCFIVSLRYVNKTEQPYLMDALGAANMACFIRGRVAHRVPETGKLRSGGTYASWLLGFNVPSARLWRAALEPLCGSPSMQADGTERSLCWEVRPL